MVCKMTVGLPFKLDTVLKMYRSTNISVCTNEIKCNVIKLIIINIYIGSSLCIESHMIISINQGMNFDQYAGNYATSID